MINETTGRRRVLLKLSGEAFGGGQLGVNPDVVSQMAREIAAAVDRVEIAVVVGGGNFFRGAELSQRGMDRGRADYMGMLGTVMNALALQDFLEQAGAATRVQSAISMTQVAEPYIPRRAERHMEKGRVVIFGAGAGLPYFSTDTVAAQRALEIDAQEVLVAKNGVDGVYTADPKKDASATRIDRITYLDALQRGLKVVDSTAFSLCMDNRMDMRVFGMEPAGNVTRALLGETDRHARHGVSASRRVDLTSPIYARRHSDRGRPGRCRSAHGPRRRGCEGGLRDGAHRAGEPAALPEDPRRLLRQPDAARAARVGQQPRGAHRSSSRRTTSRR